MELKRFLHTIIRMFWLIVLLSFIGGGLAAYITVKSYVPKYQSETTIYAVAKSPKTNGANGIDYQDILISRQLVQDYEKIVMSEKVMTKAAEELKDIGITQDELRSMILVNLHKDSSIIGIEAVSNNPETAARVSKVVTKEFIQNLYEITNSSIVGVLDEAQTSSLPMSENNNKTVAICAAAGMFIALAIIYIRELFDTTVRSAEDVEYNLKLNVIGIIPKYVIK